MAKNSYDVKSKLQAQGATVISGKSANIVADNIEAFKALLCSPELRNRVAELFPSAFADGELQMDALLHSMGQYADNVEDHESYPICWRGKAEAEKRAQTMTTATLRPCIEESVGKDGKDGAFDSQNLYIEGDNLEVLKVLERSYANAIDIIYIDPPYNTDSDFIYSDKHSDGIQTYKEYTNQIDDKGNEKSTRKEIDGATHSKWLSMMYPRLVYANRLLKENGVIFISIDDNELANLKRLCDLVFKEYNFVGQWCWFKSATPANLSLKIKKNVEYILAYEKKLSNIKYRGINKTSESNNGLMNQTNSVHILKFPPNVVDTNLKNGTYKRGRYGTKKYDIELLNDVIVENGYFKTEIILKGKFKWNQSNLDNEISKGTIISIKTKAFSPSYEKKEYDPEVPPNLIDNSVGVNTTEEAGKKLSELFDGITVFDYPKDVGLLKYLIQFKDYISDNPIILDFFSGSGTTAQAVVELNQCDNVNRQYIMVQIPEPCNPQNGTGKAALKAGFKNIAEIGKERIRRAGKAIKKEHPEANIDIGFKVFKLDSSNLKKWDDKPAEDAKEVSNRLFGAQDMMVPGRSHLDVVYEYMLKYGLTLDWPVECVKVHHKDVYVVAGGMFMVCLDHDLDIEWAKELVQLKKKLAPADWRVLVADESFGNETKTRDNNAQNIFHTLCDAGLAPVNFIIA